MTDIIKNELYISSFCHAYKGTIGRRKCKQECRSSDGFVCIADGVCHYSFADGTTFTARKGDVIYLAHLDRYEMDVDCEKYEYFVADFEFECAERRKSKLFTPGAFENVEQLFRKLLKSGSRTDSMVLIYQIYSLLRASVGTYIGRKNEILIIKAKEIIKERLFEGIEIGALTGELGISEVHFRKLFKASVGISPVKYITSSRISHAKMLMESEGMNLEEIAFECGFSSVPYFCRVFRECTGMTPTAYKKSRNI